MTNPVSNFPISYKLSWLPRLIRPSLEGERQGFLPAEGALFPPPPSSMKRLVFLGDISAVANRSAPEIDEGLRALIASADLVIGNCEAPVVERPYRRFGTVAGTRHAMTAGFLSGTLRAAGIVPARLLLSLANNHMLDQGVEGYEETRHALAHLGIATIGGVADEPFRPVDLGGLTIAFAAFTQWRNADRNDFAGRVTMLEDFANNGLAALRDSRADLVCVVPHWDREFRHFPSDTTRELAQKLAEAGAGLVVGHHAHVLQPTELVGTTLVAYGIGDFLSTALPRQPWPTRLGAVVAVEVSTDPSTRGRVAAYRFAPFFRQRAGGRERLMPLIEVNESAGVQARNRFSTLFPSTSHE
jgi:poly-gamma-glutamate capsule biosynthesis protein CapA/YwtB (metallophosphatase superfamily)